jgi:alpha-ketoglutarate-dependent taurine dioxygenase
MDTPEDPETRLALESLIAEIDHLLYEVVLGPGEFCFIDNYKAVHGRKPFKARFDGADRWLKRLNITRDLRKSSGLRADKLSRIIS